MLTQFTGQKVDKSVDLGAKLIVLVPLSDWLAYSVLIFSKARCIGMRFITKNLKNPTCWGWRAPEVQDSAVGAIMQ